MKQGHATHTDHGATKVEPKSQAVCPGGVGQIGVAIDPKAHEPMYEGRGLKAPMVGSQIHQHGSQKRHT